MNRGVTDKLGDEKFKLQKKSEELAGSTELIRTRPFSQSISKKLQQRSNARKLPTNNLEDVKEAMNELIYIRDEVKEKIKSDVSKMRNPTSEAKGWFLKVDGIEVEVNKILDDYNQRSCVEKKCALDTCITCWESCLRASDIMSIVKVLICEGCLAYLYHLQITSMSTVPVRESNLQKGLRYLTEEKVDSNGERMLGVWGPHGVGKSSLLLQIKNELTKDPEFDNVIMITASQDYTEREFQKDIAEKLNLVTENIVKDQIHDNLTQKNFVILLDDVSQPLDIEDVGIPHPLGLVDIGNPHPMTKVNQRKRVVIISSHLEQVCKKMGAKRMIEVAPLQPEEAWHLFRQQVGEQTINSDPQIEHIAKKVAKECEGLPLALITTARIMSSKTDAREWDYALQWLQKSGMTMQSVYLCKIWNEYLEDKEKLPLWECFSCCALWPKDYPIEEDVLNNCWMGHGLIPEFDADIHKAYDKSRSIIKTLSNARLLEVDKSPNEFGKTTFKTHDSIRDLILWMRGQEWLVIADEKKEEALPEDRWQAALRISIMRNNIETLPAKIPHCPNLRTMIISGNPNLQDTLTSFHLFPALKYLDLSSTNIGKIVHIIDIEGICNLHQLEYLNLSNTFIGDLPEEMKNLVNLKFLVLRGSMISSVAPGLLSGLEKLQVLDIYDYNPWVLQRSNLDQFASSATHLKGVGTNISSLEELKGHTNTPMTSLCLYCLDGESSFQLSAIKIIDRSRLIELTILRCESLREFVMDENCALSHLESLTLLYLDTLTKVIQGTYWLDGLRVLTIMGCDSLEDATWAKDFPGLEILKILHCQKMKNVFSSVVLEETAPLINRERGVFSESKEIISFRCLRRLSLSTLPSLISICDPGNSFPGLESVYLINCSKLKILPDTFPVYTKIYEEHEATTSAATGSRTETKMDAFEEMILEEHWNRAKEYSRITYLENYDLDR